MSSPGAVMLWCPTRGKRRFLDESRADAHAQDMTSKYGDLMEPYLCVCDVWHIRGVEKNRNTAARASARRGPEPNPYLPWQDGYILDHLDSTAAEIAAAIGRSQASVRTRRKKLRGSAS